MNWLRFTAMIQVKKTVDEPFLIVGKRTDIGDMKLMLQVNQSYLAIGYCSIHSILICRIQSISSLP